MSWTSDREKKLKELWNKGHTASQIAEMLGNTTRNAVIGKAHRLKLEARANTRKKLSKASSENKSTPNRAPKLGRKAKFKALLLNKDFPPEQPTKLEDLTQDTCRYPLGEKLEPAKFFCGRKPVDKFPYCQLHLLYSYQSKNEREEDMITEEDIPKFIEKKIKSA